VYIQGKEIHIMRTNIEIDDELLKQAMEATGAKTKREAVERGLQALVRTSAHQGLLDMFGKVEFDEDVIAKSDDELATEWSS
jgi:Arc/MetJ family transcription regulator